MDIQRFFNKPRSVSEDGDRECVSEGCSEAQTSEEIDSSREANVSHPIDIASRQRSSQASEPAGDLGIDLLCSAPFRTNTGQCVVVECVVIVIVVVNVVAGCVSLIILDLFRPIF